MGILDKIKEEESKKEEALEEARLKEVQEKDAELVGEIETVKENRQAILNALTALEDGYLDSSESLESFKGAKAPLDKAEKATGRSKGELIEAFKDDEDVEQYREKGTQKETEDQEEGDLRIAITTLSALKDSIKEHLPEELANLSFRAEEREASIEKIREYIASLEEKESEMFKDTIEGKEVKKQEDFERLMQSTQDLSISYEDASIIVGPLVKSKLTLRNDILCFEKHEKVRLITNKLYKAVIDGDFEDTLGSIKEVYTKKIDEALGNIESKTIPYIEKKIAEEEQKHSRSRKHFEISRLKENIEKLRALVEKRDSIVERMSQALDYQVGNIILRERGFNRPESVQRELDSMANDKNEASSALDKLTKVEASIDPEEDVSVSYGNVSIDAIIKERDGIRNEINLLRNSLENKEAELRDKRNTKPGIFGKNKHIKEVSDLERELAGIKSELEKKEDKHVELSNESSISVRTDTKSYRVKSILEDYRFKGKAKDAFRELRTDLKHIMDKKPPEDMLAVAKKQKELESALSGY